MDGISADDKNVALFYLIFFVVHNMDCAAVNNGNKFVKITVRMNIKVVFVSAVLNKKGKINIVGKPA